MVDFAIHPDAEAEYEQACLWYLDRSRQAADRFEAAFDAAIEAIRSRPEMFPKCDVAHRFVVLTRFPYRLIYRPRGEGFVTIAVAHAKRRPGYWSSRI